MPMPIPIPIPMPIRRRAAAIALAVGALVGTLVPAGPANAGPVLPPGPKFGGLGAWIDVYDYIPAFGGSAAGTTPETLERYARAGVRTVYLQVSKNDPRSPALFADRTRAVALLRKAHELGMRVVAWYLPPLAKISTDFARVEAIADLNARGHRFDAVALDIEDVTAVPDEATRNARLLRLVTRLDTVMPRRRIGAIIFAPVALEVIRPELWPNFPYAQLAAYIDVWLPMSYSTLRDPTSPYRDPARYARSNMERLRAHVPDARIHVIGGLAAGYNRRDAQRFVRTAKANDAVGWSLYDAATTSDALWTTLRKNSE